MSVGCVLCCLGLFVGLAWSGEGAVVMAILESEVSCGRAGRVEGREECPHSPGAGLKSSLPGAVYTREQLGRKIRVALPSAVFALLTVGRLLRRQMSRIRE